MYAMKAIANDPDPYPSKSRISWLNIDVLNNNNDNKNNNNNCNSFNNKLLQ